MRRPWLLVALILAVGIVGTALALRSHESNAQFAARQQGLLPVSAVALEQLVLTTNDPRPGYGGRAVDARCTTVSVSALGNPWTCVVRYPRAPRIGYRVSVLADRSIYGIGRTGGQQTPVTVRGCCVNAP
jgi:hypothetical protein